MTYSSNYTESRRSDRLFIAALLALAIYIGTRLVLDSILALAALASVVVRAIVVAGVLVLMLVLVLGRSDRLFVAALLALPR